MRTAIMLAMSIPIVLTETLAVEKARLLAQPLPVTPNEFAGPKTFSQPQAKPRTLFARGRGFR
jgi:hypothetical protein